MSGKTCPMLARSHWGLTAQPDRGAAHTLTATQSALNLRGRRTGGWLVFLNGCHAGEDVRLPYGSVEIGSSWLADVVLTGPDIGSRHAALRIDGEDAEVVPLGPTRAVRVNGELVKVPTPLVDGDLVTLGELSAVLRFAKEQTPGYAPVPRPRPALVTPSRPHTLFTAGWLVARDGLLDGQDWRLVKGDNRLGAAPDLELTIPGARLPPVALTIAADGAGLKLASWTEGCAVSVNRAAVALGTVLRDSDRLAVGTQEFYVKCL